jgi:hypothetical protein
MGVCEEHVATDEGDGMSPVQMLISELVGGLIVGFMVVGYFFVMKVVTSIGPREWHAGIDDLDSFVGVNSHPIGNAIETITTFVYFGIWLGVFLWLGSVFLWLK